MSRLLDEGADVNARIEVQDWGWTPLFFAIEHGKAAAVAWLLAHGADPNARAADGGSPLHLAIDCEAITAHEWDSEPSAELCELLLAAGADANAPDGQGLTPLDWAIRLVHAAAERELTRRGARRGALSWRE